ncbi:acyl-CoA reductase-like NAD-dependent aldehyde dehydrogenase [Novosphingobium capsulatum]|uniref:Acyl-CoA reductase-like NAD-dependent aldehyde dehydrogenase n=1 Tax=Novosphingobium capsulatum TaxID=13688 RepID=A0ABU1MQD1_9SPHN|nr:acyl-CoA reductase-like NAD-dependent aldehyde dehydrogenase [Novosphingobium capsulatum]
MTEAVAIEPDSLAAAGSQAFNLLIDGELVDAASTFPVINPATAEPFALCPKADESMLDRAVLAARRAFASWSARPVEERAALLLRLADAMESRLEDFAALLTREQGKPLAQARMELLGSIGTLRAFSAMRIETRLLREREGSHVVEHRRPLGVVAAITHGISRSSCS